MDKQGKQFVLVHGACHGAWSWYKVATQLRSVGHWVTAIDLAASGVHPKKAEDIQLMQDYMEPLMEFMESVPENGRVVLVGHSTGGFSVSVAMERFPQKIAVAVFVAAMMPQPDCNILTLSKEFDHQLKSQMDNQFRFDKGQDKPPTSIIYGPKFLSSKLYNLSPREDLTLATWLVRPYPLYDNEESLLSGTELTRAKYGKVRRVYIVLEDDCMNKERLQRWMIGNNMADEVKVIAGSDHMVMCSKPLVLCSYLQEIAEKYL